jgi:hypothetical protein
MKKPHPDFDGHLKKPLSEMTPKEKLLWISLNIKLYHDIKNRVKKADKK